MAPVRAERQSNPDAVSGRFDLLDQYYLREPQLVRRPQADRNRCTRCLCAISCCRDLPRPGTGSTVFRNYADFQHTVAQRSCAAVVRLRRVSDTGDSVRRAGATVVEVPSSHAIYAFNPSAVAVLIEQAVSSVRYLLSELR